MTKTFIRESPWKYLPVKDELFHHEEHYCKEEKSGKYNIAGARVRGKKHRHDGSNCDDWFEFATEGPWTFIAVSDGAGSEKFSRRGAKISCRSAVQCLINELKNHKIHKTNDLAEKVFSKNARGEYEDDDMEFVKKSLHKSINEAHKSLFREIEGMKNDKKYYDILGREPVIDDLSCTILLAVHYMAGDYSIVFTCQIGDGITGVIGDMGLFILGLADSGDFAGETDFLTSPERLTEENLNEKTFAYSGNMKALMVMTDGVCDDYFPYEPELLRLYGDLVINDIINPCNFSEEEIKKSMPEIGTISDISDYSTEGEKITEKGAEIIPILSMEAYSRIIEKSLWEIISEPTLLYAGKKESYFSEKGTPSERLLEFLASYHVRGSFDDRTLIIMYREGL